MSSSDAEILLLDGFEDYTVETTATPTAFIVGCSVFVGLSFCVIAPLVACSRYVETKRQRESLINDSNNNEHCEEQQPVASEQEMVEFRPPEASEAQLNDAETNDVKGDSEKRRDSATVETSQNLTEDVGASQPTRTSEINGTHGEEHHPHSSPLHFASATPQDAPQSQPLDQSSNVPSVATTSRLHASAPNFTNTTSSRQAAAGKRRTSRGVWEPAAMRWKHKRPLGRIESMERSVRSERLSHASEEGSSASRSRAASWASRPGSQVSTSRRLSNLASGVLEMQNIEGEADFYRQRYVQRASRIRRLSSGDRSAMPGLSPSILAPEDAADAFDPGVPVTRRSSFEEPSVCCGPLGIGCGRLLDLAEPDSETRRIISLAIPATIRAVAEPLFRFVLVALICNFIDTDSSIAYVLVTLFLRLTMEELSAAVCDTESALIQSSLAEGGDAGFYKVGQNVQLSVLMQILIGGAVLVVWVFFMDDVVLWLVDKPSTAAIAADYAQIIVIDVILHAATRAFMLIFHIAGHEQFEVNVDLCAALIILTAVGLLVGLNDDATLVNIAWIQVSVGIAKMLTKVTYVTVKGWLQPYKQGLLGRLTLLDTKAVAGFLAISFPLLLGSLIELREWELLTLFVQSLGGAEVATWALMGVVWEILEALTEGLGDAGAIRVAFFLEEGQPAQAKRLSSKVVFMALIQALVISSIFLMAGPNIAIALTKDSTLENLFNQLVGMTALANFSMSFAQVYWSLVGAQGRFGLASMTILACRWLITMPLALGCIYGLMYDLRSVAGSIAVGYATAASILAYNILQSDWRKLAMDAQAHMYHGDASVDFSEDEEEDLDEESSSDDVDEEDGDEGDGNEYVV